MPIGVWLRQQREARGLARREMARRLIAAGKAAGDTSVPDIESVCAYIRRWESGEHALTERYKLYYCEVFGITADEFGRQAPGAGHIATVNAHGLSVSLQYVCGRLLIEVSGLEISETEAGPEPRLALVDTPGPPRSYGGRA
jgi:transcriptional regulator with XRE-family HTH domain